MMEIKTTSEIKGMTLSAIIIRADGTIEDLGEIASQEAGTITIEEPPSFRQRVKMEIVKEKEKRAKRKEVSHRRRPRANQ